MAVGAARAERPYRELNSSFCGGFKRGGCGIIYFLTALLSAAAGFFIAYFLRRSRQRLRRIPVNLHDLLTDCRTLITPKAAEKGLRLHFYAEPAISKMPLGDPSLLRDALLSLLANAVKYTNTGMVKLHSAIKDTNDKTVTISFEVKDSGIGVMSGQEREAKDIVKMLGGKLMVECVPGVGSRCSFDLTFDTINVTGGDDGRDAVIDEFEMPMFEGEVLLCEDNDMNQQIVCEHLTRVGLKIVVADNGKIGVEMVQDRVKKREKLFDLILMDIHMPVMDGLEAAAKITELNTGIPIMALTANIMSNDLEIYRMSGMYDFVGKPFTSQQLWRALSKYFKPVNRQTEGGYISAENHRIWVENKLRRKIIGHFVNDNQNIIVEIKDAIREGDIKLAHRIAHTLKGSAGQVGKILLQQAAAEVEQNLKDGQNRVTPRQMATLAVELNAALAELIPLANEFTLAKRT